MKAVILLAGKGRRLGDITKDLPKSMIKLQNKELLGHLIENLIAAQVDEIIPILGFKNDVLNDYLQSNYGEQVKISPIINPDFETTNNLYTLLCAKQRLQGESFLLLNGDLIINWRIFKDIIDNNHDSCIALDDTGRENEEVDSPRTVVEENRILDLGRHLEHQGSGGYAIGVYKIGSELSTDLFNKAQEMIDSGNVQAGFHDPLIDLFPKHNIMRHSTRGLLWTDIDEESDIAKANQMILDIMNQNKN